jgi:hypothetical protein
MGSLIFLTINQTGIKNSEINADFETVKAGIKNSEINADFETVKTLKLPSLSARVFDLPL